MAGRGRYRGVEVVGGEGECGLGGGHILSIRRSHNHRLATAIPVKPMLHPFSLARLLKLLFYCRDVFDLPLNSNPGLPIAPEHLLLLRPFQLLSNGGDGPSAEIVVDLAVLFLLAYHGLFEV